MSIYRTFTPQNRQKPLACSSEWPETVMLEMGDTTLQGATACTVHYAVHFMGAINMTIQHTILRHVQSMLRATYSNQLYPK